MANYARGTKVKGSSSKRQRMKYGPEGRRAKNVVKGTKVKGARRSKHGPEGKFSTDVNIKYPVVNNKYKVGK